MSSYICGFEIVACVRNKPLVRNESTCHWSEILLASSYTYNLCVKEYCLDQMCEQAKWHRFGVKRVVAARHGSGLRSDHRILVFV